jgi:hypothetical protein
MLSFSSVVYFILIICYFRRYNTEGFTWDNLDGYITWGGKTPFKPTIFEPYLGAHEVNTTGMDGYLTNSQLWSLLAPKSNSIDYVYDQVCLKQQQQIHIKGDTLKVENVSRSLANFR